MTSNTWKAAIELKLCSFEMTCENLDNNPHACLNYVIDNEISQALDPLISRRARDLVTQYVNNTLDIVQYLYSKGIPMDVIVKDLKERN